LAAEAGNDRFASWASCTAHGAAPTKHLTSQRVTATGGARLGGKTGKRDSGDAGLDAFLGQPKSSSGDKRAPRQQQQSLDDIERMLLQAAPQDLSEAVKRHKKPNKQN
jgi:hypothetical protein